MLEKRISVRTNMLCVRAGVSEEGESWTNVDVRDISDGGLSFTSRKVLKKDSFMKFEGDVSDYMIRSMDISCDIQITFVKEDDKGGGYLYGARFLNLTNAQRTSLSIFIELMVTKFPDLMEI